ncbi:MAG: hypothetical protein IJW33_00420 [Lentisphaeria bacterium]|nr:hypothetical protein [Lentisphaeria bacterium]
MKKLLLIGSLMTLFTFAGAAEMPKEFSVNCGDLEFTLSQRTFWNLRGVIFKGKKVTSPKSWYGSVTAGQPGIKGWVGSGHMENGIGEKNLKLSFKLDGKEWTPAAGTAAAKTFEMTKESDLGNLHLVYNLKISGNTVEEEVKYSMLKRNLILIYHFMQALDKSFTAYTLTNNAGEVTRGEFKGKEENIYFKNPKRFTAWSPKLSAGVICTIENSDALSKESYIRLHDRASFRKFYFGPAPRIKVSAGKVYTQKMTSSYFTGSLEDFEKLTK